jgi:RNA polymerase sigma factor (sigma-70 family)
LSEFLTLAKKPTPFTNSQIIAGLDKRDNKVVQNIKDCYHKPIIAGIVRNGGVRQDAEDAFQDTIIDFIILAQRNKLNIKSGTFGAYFSRAVYNKWTKRYKDKLFKGRVDIDENIDIIEDPFEMTDQYHELSESLKQLTDNCLKILNERYYKDLDWNTIARKLGYSDAGSARNQGSRCLQRIRLVMDMRKYNL